MDAAIGDFDGDGMKDVVLSLIGLLVGDGTYVYLNNGDGSFNKDPDIKLGAGSTAVDAGDLNNDGYDDIVCTLTVGGGADCYFGGSNGPDNTADISFLKGGTATVTPNEVLVQDVDQDGYLDVLFAVLVNTEAPVFIGGISGPDNVADYKLTLKSSPLDVSAGDINDDGYIDIAYSTVDNTGAGSNIEIYKGTSIGWNANNKYAIAAGNSLHPVEVVDIDLDGYADIVTGEAASFKLYMGGSTWPTSVDLTLAGLTSPQDVTVAVPSGGGGGGTFRGSFLT
ncbi:MAG: VCBS repeat-containing protein, partial [Planctomycetes bacterium]|nr:VCBS repeat-containing protein [Planctomycetota bacterium]